MKSFEKPRQRRDPLNRRVSDTVTSRARCGKLVLWLLTWVACHLGLAASADDELTPKFRPPDDRPVLDVRKLEASGIRLFESKRLRLFTDVDESVAKPLPTLVDQAYELHEKYFGKLLPSRDGREFQINGYLMRDKVLFQQAGVLRDGLGVEEFHGRQIGYQIWLMEQKTDYYRRHLLLHEATHAFMRAIPNLDAPLSYLEGMAEHFGTHRWEQNQLTMRVMPHNRSDFRGHDRLFVLRREAAERGVQNLSDIGRWPAGSFQFFGESYAWSWASCLFLDSHPRTRERFRMLAKSLSDPFAWTKFENALEPEWNEIISEWNLFASEAFESFDFDRMAVDFRDGMPIRDSSKPARVEIRSDRGWQPSGVLVEKDREYEVRATGQFTLADKPKPWVSEADGVSIRYHRQVPLGRLLMSIRDAEAPELMREWQSLGANGRFKASRTGTLYLRLNDHPGELSDNKGSVSVTVQLAEAR